MPHIQSCTNRCSYSVAVPLNDLLQLLSLQDVPEAIRGENNDVTLLHLDRIQRAISQHFARIPNVDLSTSTLIRPLLLVDETRQAKRPVHSEELPWSTPVRAHRRFRPTVDLIVPVDNKAAITDVQRR